MRGFGFFFGFLRRSGTITGGPPPVIPTWTIYGVDSTVYGNDTSVYGA